MNAAQNRFKQVNAPLGLSSAAPGLPVQGGTERRDLASGIVLSSAAALAANVGAL